MNFQVALPLSQLIPINTPWFPPRWLDSTVRLLNLKNVDSLVPRVGNNLIIYFYIKEKREKKKRSKLLYPCILLGFIITEFSVSDLVKIDLLLCSNDITILKLSNSRSFG